MQIECAFHVDTADLIQISALVWICQLRPQGRSFLLEFGRSIQEETGEDISGYQTVVQRGNAAIMLGTTSVRGDLSDPFCLLSYNACAVDYHTMTLRIHNI